MSSNYFGEPNMGNERGASGGSSSSSSSRKGKKNNSDKPKQPQRGLGVAQLEKIRLHGQMACGGFHPSLHSPYPSNFNNNEDPRMQIAYSSTLPSSSSSFSYSSSSPTSYSPSYGFQPNIIMMGIPEYEKSSIRYGDSQPTNTARWEHANAIFENQSPAQSNMTIPFLNLQDIQDIDTRRQRSGSALSSSQNSESSDTQELDLELRLSI